MGPAKVEGKPLNLTVETVFFFIINFYKELDKKKEGNTEWGREDAVKVGVAGRRAEGGE